jgi:tRNA-specific 2-thiouridylase
MKKNIKKEKVFVGVSGGVDSSVSLALLKEKGYDVVGVFIKTWQPDFIECTWRKERQDAMRVCASLKVPFLECDLEKEYREKVAMYMIEEYKKGKTPNPDVMCNKEIKFGGFLDFAISHGASYVATGHYAQVFKDKNGLHKLMISKDKNKDQTYFLWTLKEKELGKILFPVGHLNKREVRVLAQKFNLPTAFKKDSQGVCFLGMIDMKDFLGHFIKEKKGNVLDENGNIVGYHNGVLFFTIGERHGFFITKKTTNDKPYYVFKKDVKSNILYVTNNTSFLKTGDSAGLKITDTVFREKINTNKIYTARIRYRQELKKCKINFISENESVVYFEDNNIFYSSGQSLVLYDKNICIGGGIID